MVVQFYQLTGVKLLIKIMKEEIDLVHLKARSGQMMLKKLRHKAKNEFKLLKMK